MKMRRLRHQPFALLPLVLALHTSFCSNGTTSQLNNYTKNVENEMKTCNKDSNKDLPYRITLIIIYTLVLLVGSIGVSLMINVLKSNLRSWTTITFFNLILVHVIFMATIPFRIYYYVKDCWELGLTFCKVVSSMIHLHMHVVFIIYVIILTMHFLHYFKKVGQMELNRSLHAMVFSIGIWSLVIIIGPVVLAHYGMNTTHTDNKCFHFAKELNNTVVHGCNVFLSVGTIILSCIVSFMLAVILYSMIKKYGASSCAHQEFWAQMKNVSLVLIILFSLAPYHLFRLYYLQTYASEEKTNEVFLAITSLTCFDMMFIFAGKGLCHRCGG